MISNREGSAANAGGNINKQNEHSVALREPLSPVEENPQPIRERPSRNVRYDERPARSSR